jgi:hypothetical protein
MKIFSEPILLLSFLMVLIFNGCSISSKTEKPVESYQPTVTVLEPSIINLSFETRLSDIQNALNEAFTGLIYDDNSLEDNGGDNLMVKAWKEGNILLAMKENVLIYKVPLKVWIKAGFKKSAFGYAVSDYRELNAALTLNFRTEIILLPDWSIQTLTSGTDYKWTKEPVVKVGGLNIPVTFVADILLKQNLKTISKGIDESLKTWLDFKPYATEAWKALNSPIVLNETNKIWLQVLPSAFYASPLKASGNRIHFSAGLQSVITSGVGTSPKKTASLPLPLLNITDPTSDLTIINAMVELPFDELNAYASGYVKGQSFTQGKRSVKVEDIKLYGSNGLMVAEVKLSGSYKGSVYFKGIPGFRDSDSTLILRQFDFDIKTRNMLIKSVNWLYQDGFRTMIGNRMKWPLATDLRNLSSGINKNLNSWPLAPGLELKGSMSKLSYNEIVIRDRGIEVYLTAEGKLAIYFRVLENRK